jgi:type II secretory pathway predicted ATPase ExeA
MSYSRFAAMVLTSTVLMFGLMYLNTYQFDHIAFSQTRAWMALLMGSVMAAVMLLFMWGMYKNRTAKLFILALAALVFAGSLWLTRSQTTVSDADYMRAMIPHHSIAILTSTQASIRDPRVRALADQIIEAQVKEIAEMKQLIAELESNPISADTPELTPLNPEEVN